MRLEVRCKRVYIGARRPEYAHPGDAGLDLFAAQSGAATLRLYPGTRATIGCGWAFEIPDGYVGLVQPRSGLASREGVLAATGVIDSSFRGEVGVTLYNHGADPLDVPFGAKIAQLVVVPIPDVDLVEVDELTTTNRGVNGYGSTGR